jgi:hypothetical protein
MHHPSAWNQLQKSSQTQKCYVLLLKQISCNVQALEDNSNSIKLVRVRLHIHSFFLLTESNPRHYAIRYLNDIYKKYEVWPFNRNVLMSAISLYYF